MTMDYGGKLVDEYNGFRNDFLYTRKTVLSAQETAKWNVRKIELLNRAKLRWMGRMLARESILYKEHIVQRMYANCKH